MRHSRVLTSPTRELPVGPVACSCCIYASGVFGHPSGERLDGAQEFPAQICKGIFDLWWHHGRDSPGDETVLFKIAQCRGQDLLTDLANLSAQRIKTMRPAPKRAYDQQGPLVADPREHATDVFAAGGIVLVTRCR